MAARPRDALYYHACSSDFSAKYLEQRERRPLAPSSLHLPHKQDLLDLELHDPDLSVFDTDDMHPDPGDTDDEAQARRSYRRC